MENEGINYSISTLGSENNTMLYFEKRMGGHNSKFLTTNRRGNPSLLQNGSKLITFKIMIGRWLDQIKYWK